MMNREIEKIADAILYEGYALFPYRKNALKNQRRFNFGVLSPKAWAEKQANEQFFQQTEILLMAEENAKISFEFRYLQLETSGDWQTARENVVENSVVLDDVNEFDISDSKFHINGTIKVKIENLEKNLFKLTFKIVNTTENASFKNLSREDMLAFSFVSAHTIFEIENGEFFSVIEPPEKSLKYSQTLENINCFPVLVGDSKKRNSMLSAPVILYDFPDVAENSFDNFFDGLEIDELMVLNILALTDEEKAQIRQTDERTRKILEKIESASAEELLKLHAVMNFR